MSIKQKKMLVIIFLLTILAVVIFLILGAIHLIGKAFSKEDKRQENNVTNQNTISQTSEPKKEKVIDDWRLVLVNYNNPLPEDFEVALTDIDQYRKFDSRAISYLNQMIQDMKSDGITAIWVQSGYRSIDSQTKVFNEQVEKFIEERKVKARSRKANNSNYQ